MAHDNRTTRRRRRADRLDPVRWHPRRRTLLRLTLVAALLTLAAAVLFGAAPTRGRAAATCTAARPAAPASPKARPGGPLPVPAGLVGVPVRVAGAGLVGLVRPGDRVDVTAAPTDTASTAARIVARDALVLRGTMGDSADTEGGSVIYLAMTEDEARQVGGAAPDARLGVVVRPR